ncbi:MAG: hypothetical protein KBA95_19835 [Acidobacteria bacterium]|nr:hypothetical protein [Acidobacteriota bacterium]
MATLDPIVDPLVQVPLSEIQRIRDALGRLPERHKSNLIRQLFGQVAGLYQRLKPQTQDASSTP